MLNLNRQFSILIEMTLVHSDGGLLMYIDIIDIDIGFDIDIKGGSG